MAVEEHQAPIGCSPAPAVTRPEDLEDAACWPVTHLAALLQSRQVSSLELTKMYLERLHRYQPPFRRHLLPTAIDCRAIHTEPRLSGLGHGRTCPASDCWGLAWQHAKRQRR